MQARVPQRPVNRVAKPVHAEWFGYMNPILAVVRRRHAVCVLGTGHHHASLWADALKMPGETATITALHDRIGNQQMKIGPGARAGQESSGVFVAVRLRDDPALEAKHYRHEAAGWRLVEDHECSCRRVRLTWMPHERATRGRERCR